MTAPRCPPFRAARAFGEYLSQSHPENRNGAGRGSGGIAAVGSVHSPHPWGLASAPAPGWPARPGRRGGEPSSCLVGQLPRPPGWLGPEPQQELESPITMAPTQPGPLAWQQASWHPPPRVGTTVSGGQLAGGRGDVGTGHRGRRLGGAVPSCPSLPPHKGGLGEELRDTGSAAAGPGTAPGPTSGRAPVGSSLPSELQERGRQVLGPRAHPGLSPRPPAGRRLLRPRRVPGDAAPAPEQAPPLRPL